MALWDDNDDEDKNAARRGEATKPQPEQPVARPASARPAASPVKEGKARSWRSIGLVFLCFVAGVLGSTIVLMAQGDVRNVTTDSTREAVTNEGELVAETAERVGRSTVSISTESAGPDTILGGGLQQGAGTGIIVSDSGYVLTNRHVIPENTGSVDLITSDGTEYNDVRVVGRDNVNDIAFLKIENGQGLQAAEIGDSAQMRVGEKVIAVGNALGQFQNTVTTGVISGISRPIVAQEGAGRAETLENLFQTDAAINPGNSGGPLVNMEGEVIGINTAVAENAENLGFAIPINDAKGLIDSVTQEGRLIRPYVGIRSISLTPAIARELDVDAETGAYVVEDGVVEGSPAARAGVRQGDIVTKVGDRDVNQQNSLSSIVSTFDIGQEISMEVRRGGERLTLEATLEEFPDNL